MSARQAALLLSGCPLTVGAFALPALAGIVLLQYRGLVLRSCGLTSSRDKLQKLRRRCRCRGAALALPDLAWLVDALRLRAAIE